MSQENVEIVRQALEAFNEGDVEGSFADIAPEFEYIPTGSGRPRPSSTLDVCLVDSGSPLLARSDDP